LSSPEKQQLDKHELEEIKKDNIEAEKRQKSKRKYGRRINITTYAHCQLIYFDGNSTTICLL